MPGGASRLWVMVVISAATVAGTSWGHRKHLNPTSSELDLNNHTVKTPQWSQHHESTDVAWLRHF